MKSKILKVVVILSCVCIILFSVTLPASALSDLKFTSVRVADRELSFHINEVSISDNLIDMCFPYESGVREAEFHFNTPTSYSTGDKVTISFSSWFYAYSIQQIEIYFYNHLDVFTSSDMVWYDDGTSFFNLNFNKTYSFNSSVDASFVIIVRCSETAHIGFSSFDFTLNNDPSVAINNQTNDLKQNQDKNFDKLFNGDGSGGSYARPDASGDIGDLNDATGSLDDATKNAMGGYTAVDAITALDDAWFDVSDVSNSNVALFIEYILMACDGPILLMLFVSVVLGTCAFVIGRRF